MSHAEPKVHVIDDDSAMRRALTAAIGAAGYETQGHADADAFLEHYDPDQPGCLLLDLHLPGISGFELMERCDTIPQLTPTIILTGQSDVQSAVQAMKAGAVDYIEKPFNQKQLLACVRDALVLSARRLDKRRQQEQVHSRLVQLTPRERQLLEQLVQGKSNKQVAGDWYVSLRTIENHRAHLMRKMRAKNVADLVRMVATSNDPIRHMLSDEMGGRHDRYSPDERSLST